MTRKGDDMQSHLVYRLLLVLLTILATVISKSISLNNEHDLIPPVIQDVPQPDYVYDKARGTTLPCNASSNSPQSYQWFKNGNAFGSAAADGSLAITAGEVRDVEGFYHCAVRNEAGFALSNNILLQAAYRFSTEDCPKCYNRTVLHVSESERSSVELNCYSNGFTSIPKCSSPAFRWVISASKDQDVDVNKNDPRFAVTQTGSLIIMYLTESDVSRDQYYTCWGDYRGTECEGNKFRLTIDKTKTRSPPLHPTIHYKSTSLTVLERKKAVLECVFVGVYGAEDELPQTEWRDPSGNVINDDRLSLHGRVVTISSATEEDSGIYTCTGKFPSTSGVITERIVLMVDAKPRLAKVLSDTQVTTGGSKAFVCAGLGRPSPNVQWFINATDIHDIENVTYSLEDNDTKLTISNIHYRLSVACNVSNIHGAEVYNAHVQIRKDAFSYQSTPENDLPILPVLSSTFSSDKKDTNTRPEYPTTPRSEIDVPPSSFPFISTPVLVKPAPHPVSTSGTVNQASSQEGSVSPGGSVDGHSSLPAIIPSVSLLALGCIVTVATVLVFRWWRRRKNDRSYTIKTNEDSIQLKGVKRTESVKDPVVPAEHRPMAVIRHQDNMNDSHSEDSGIDDEQLL